MDNFANYLRLIVCDKDTVNMADSISLMERACTLKLIYKGFIYQLQHLYHRSMTTYGGVNSQCSAIFNHALVTWNVVNGLSSRALSLLMLRSTKYVKGAILQYFFFKTSAEIHFHVECNWYFTNTERTNLKFLLKVKKLSIIV